MVGKDSVTLHLSKYAGDYLVHHRVDKRIACVDVVLGLELLALETVAVVNRTHALFEGGNYCFPSWGALFLSCSLFFLITDWKPVEFLLISSIHSLAIMPWESIYFT